MPPPEPSDKSRGLALGLAIPLGVLGVHRFYVGKPGTGVLMLLTGGGAAVWWILDIVRIASGDFRDRFDRPVVAWDAADYDEHLLSTPELVDEIDALNEELDEVSARLERAERRLDPQAD